MPVNRKIWPLKLYFLLLLVPGVMVSDCGNTAASSKAGLPSRSAVSNTLYVQKVALGNLSISPIQKGNANAKSNISWSESESIFKAASAVQGSHQIAILGYGLATIRSMTLPHGLPAIAGTPAWIGIAWGGTTGCPAQSVSSQKASPNTEIDQIYTAVIINGNSKSNSVVYKNQGPLPCAGKVVGPTIEPLSVVESVNWQELSGSTSRKLSIRYDSSSCEKLFSAAANGNMKTGNFQVSIEVAKPINVSGCIADQKTTEVRLFPAGQRGIGDFPSSTQVSHAPVGLISVLRVSKVYGS
ncbi:hypothetical protein AXFE_36640 [Acidithrix ferrooxidans]|uniref:Uncharacterized protein n=1 Tax=Acidithrix ferrooxidans TaxID=1280514 RepID=A0A0D8HEL6_9ACTN|nr:hypothetical protein AXFE_36640 [Acidithrix ferrooxidans]